MTVEAPKRSAQPQAQRALEMEPAHLRMLAQTQALRVEPDEQGYQRLLQNVPMYQPASSWTPANVCATGVTQNYSAASLTTTAGR